MLLSCLAALFVFSSGQTAQAQSTTSREYKFKVAYLYNFTRYVHWPGAPKSPNEPFVIGVLGPDPFGSTLDTLARKKKAKKRKIIVKRFATAADYQPCHILFVSGGVTTAAHLDALKRTGNAPVLIVGESADFAQRGASMTFFFDVDGTIGFELNINALKKRQLRVDAKLMKLARITQAGS